MFRHLVIGLLTILLSAGCGKYSRGDRFIPSFEDDSLIYVIAAKGSGQKILDKSSQLKIQHESRGNSCELIFLTDSVKLKEGKGLLLLNSTLPNLEDDFLSKGFIGQFSSRQVVSYLLVSYEDVEKYLIRQED